MIEIISAFYSNKDVTNIVSSQVINDKLSIIASNNLFGDPTPNVVKYLNIKYKEDGEFKEITIKEGNLCVLPIATKITKIHDGTKKIKFIIPIPDVSYYLWQVLVQINNFRKMGYEIDAHYPVCCFYSNPSNIIINLMKSTNIKSKFHIYHDDRKDQVYTASMKPWLMSKYFEEFPEEKDNIYIYLDPDVIFFKHINWEEFIDDDIWYESDTCSYLDSRYIRSKSDELFIEMCDIVGISPQLVINNDLNCGGAQYITKNNTWQYWKEVETTSVPLYKHMVATSEKYKKEGQIYPIQAWTSEMWTTNWVLWKNGVKTKCIDELNFHWANHHIRDLRYSIYHNAGVVDNNGAHFSKIAYQKSPFKQELKGSTESISYKYIEEIKDTENNFSELINLFQ